MTQLDSRHARHGRPVHRSLRPRDLTIAALLVAVPATVVVCLLFGLGLGARAPGSVALAAAIALTILPILGLGAGIARLGSARRGGGSGTVIVATWLWTLAVLLTVPAFAPGLRSQAARDGADALFARFLGPLRGPAAGSVGALAGLLGSDGKAAAPASPDPLALAPDPAPPADSSASAQPKPPAPVPADPPTRPPIARPAPPADAATPVVLTYRGDGRELDVEVALDGPDFGERFRMIFDTGASFTTVTPEALGEIDVQIPADAPRVTLNTAGGQVQAALVLLDAVWMGDVPIEWVTVAACPSCTAPGRAGLLGLNVSSQFRVEIDHDRKRIHLEPSLGDRRHDIRPWLDLHARGVQHGAERIDFDVTVKNKAPRAIASATIEIDCGSGGYAVEVVDVPARGERTTGLSVPVSAQCESFRLDLLSARWVLDRF